jgi:hypothetical protein
VEGAPLGELDEPEALAALDDDVQPPVVEPLEYLGDRGTRTDLAQPVVVRVDEPELDVLLEALAHELAVARLEDVQRHLLRRQEDDSEREEPYLAHWPEG